MMVDDLKSGKPKSFLDPNLMNPDGTTSIANAAFSIDGKFLAYSIKDNGSDWETIKFKTIPDGKDLPDTLTHAKATLIAWTGDNQGIFYSVGPSTYFRRLFKKFFSSINFLDFRNTPTTHQPPTENLLEKINFTACIITNWVQTKAKIL